MGSAETSPDLSSTQSHSVAPFSIAFGQRRLEAVSI